MRIVINRYEHSEINYLWRMQRRTICPEILRFRGAVRKISLTDGENLMAARNWTFNSDHLPVGGRVNDLRMATLNGLNTAYLGHLKKMPGWKDSHLILAGTTPSKVYEDATLREEDLCTEIQNVLVRDASLDVLCLQECSERMYALLTEILEPQGVAVVLGDGVRGGLHDKKMNNYVATLVNTYAYAIRDVQIKGVFHRYIKEQNRLFLDIWRPGVDLVLESKKSILGRQTTFRLLNLHISSAGESEQYKGERLEEVKNYTRSASKAPKRTDSKPRD